nr:MAG TPA: Toxin Ibs, type I toxin-antitoxin system [Caudoviricetes sp.]
MELTTILHSRKGFKLLILYTFLVLLLISSPTIRIL